MATEPTPQRTYRTACPHCGAPVDFRSAASPMAVCSFCRSTLVRDGDALRRIGQSAELFEDHSPLQLGAAGRYQGAAFTLIGRLQLRYAQGVWNEWHALFDTGRSGWLSEDNGRYVMAFDAALSGAAPAADSLVAGQRCLVEGQAWDVASVAQARVNAVQGELPSAPNLKDEFFVVDLRSVRDEVATLDYSNATRVGWSVGRSVALSELAMTGLADVSEKTLGVRGVTCPSCGAALDIKLSTTQSIVCSQCRAVVDVSQGLGGELAHYAQDNPHLEGGEPQIPLGSVGTLALGDKTTPLPWQVVGYAERCEQPDDPDDEQTFWREYLLYHRTEGFAFLVDAEDGWSWANPITGVPQPGRNQVTWRGRTYRQLYSYKGRTTYVLGEFYWKLRRGELTFNTDYAVDRFRLNREQTGGAGTPDSAGGGEVTWSAGETLAADAVILAFKLPEAQRAAMQRDVSPLTANAAGRAFSGTSTVVWGLIAMIVVVVLMSRCSSSDCDALRSTFGEASTEYQQCVRSGSGGSGFRTGGGSFGGFGSGGGGHK